MLSIGPGHIKLSQPGQEVSSSLNDPYLIYAARGSPRLPQPGPQVANNPNDHYTICMTVHAISFPRPFNKCSLSLELILLEEMTQTLSFDIIMPLCALRIVLYQDTFFSPKLYCV